MDKMLIKKTMMVREIALIYHGRARDFGNPVVTPDCVVKYLRRSGFTNEPRESFMAVYLNGRIAPLALPYRVSIGTLNASLVHPREVFQPAIHLGAAALILAHNHPSGNAAPSTEDVALTQRLVEAGKLLGIKVLDHVIVCAKTYHSMQEHGEITF